VLLLSCSLYNLPKENRYSRSYYKGTFPERRPLYMLPSLFTQPAVTPLQHQIAWWHPKVPRLKGGQYLRYQSWHSEFVSRTPYTKGSKETSLLGCYCIKAPKSRRTCPFNKEEESCKSAMCPNKKAQKEKAGQLNSHARDFTEHSLKR